MTPNRKTILLIDDQSEMPLLVALQQEGYEVIAVDSPQMAWNVAWTLRPHFIIVHLSNPSRHNIYTLQGCAVLAAGVPVIIAAPIVGSEAIVKALEKVASVSLSFPLGPCGIGKILAESELLDQEKESGAGARPEK